MTLKVLDKHETRFTIFSNRQQTTDNRQQTTNSLKNLFIALTAIILAFTLAACGGGGGGGGGAVSGFQKAQPGEVHNGGGAGGWGKGTTTGSGLDSASSSDITSDEPLISQMAALDNITSVRIELKVNGVDQEAIIADATTTKDVLPVIKPEDTVSGTAYITLAGGTTRVAHLEETTAALGKTLSFKVPYYFKAYDLSGTLVKEGEYFARDGINLSAVTTESIAGWQCIEDGTTHNGSYVSGVRGDITLNAVFGAPPVPPIPEGFVLVGDLYVCIHEVTQAEYEEYCGYGGSSPNATYGVGPDYPAYYVSWYDALVYCNRRSMAENLTPCYTIGGSTDPAVWGSVPTSSNATWNAVTMDTGADGYRLPTEAEWLQAADDGHTYSGSDTADDVAWHSGNSSKAHEVKTKAPNANGIYDMSGNVYEWCWDASSSDRVYRGGSWDYSASRCAVSYRNYRDPVNRNYFIGFRLVRKAD